jgi:hypothetical protein
MRFAGIPRHKTLQERTAKGIANPWIGLRPFYPQHVGAYMLRANIEIAKVVLKAEGTHPC